jgi:uncharacterized protein
MEISVVDDNKVARLTSTIAALGSVAVAFSGGTDSSLLLAYCLRVLGTERVLAVTADTPSLPRRELAEAKVLAAELGAAHVCITTNELHDPQFSSNPPDRCYFCKRELFTRMRARATAMGYRQLAYGATADDTSDYRPGMRAAREAGAVAPLLEAGLTKSDIRDLSRQIGLHTWNKPSQACLSSRFPYGAHITADGLARVERGEEYLRYTLGFGQVRLRDHGLTARIEVETQQLPRLLDEEIRRQVVAFLKQLGYLYVTLDLEGFRSGSMNEALGVRAPD